MVLVNRYVTGLISALKVDWKGETTFVWMFSLDFREEVALGFILIRIKDINAEIL